MCEANQSRIDDPETKLEALLGADGFDFLETRRDVHLGKSSIQYFHFFDTNADYPTRAHVTR